MNKILQTPFQRFNDFNIDKQWNIFKIHFISCDVSPDSCVERYCVEFWYSRHSSLQYTVVTSIWHTIFCYPFFFHRDLLFFFLVILNGTDVKIIYQLWNDIVIFIRSFKTNACYLFLLFWKRLIWQSPCD